MLFRVDVNSHKSTWFYIEADTKEEATISAEELADDSEWFDWVTDDLDVNIAIADKVPEHALIWAGGPEGDWL